MSDQTMPTVFTADFPYFRLAREKWAWLLTRLGQMGVTGLAVAVPWGFHEVEPGLIDLTGDANPRRDLVGLLKLCQAFELTCLLKLGPRIINEGVLAEGLPLWLLKVADFESALPEAAQSWFKTVGQTLLEYQAGAGPIIALQLEAETPRSPLLSQQLTDVKWPIWLRKHYGSAEALNAAYGSSYRSVNEVKFPADWSSGGTPLQRDAQAFLAQVHTEIQGGYQQVLREMGWQIPIYLSASEIPGQNVSLTLPTERASFNSAELAAGFNFQQAIEVDPDPADIGRGTVWAAGAPIRPDGTLRPTFWLARQAVWTRTLPQTRLIEQTLVATFPNGSLVTRAGDSPLKIDLPAEAKAKIYRLRVNGELVAEDSLKASRGKLAGAYHAEDEIAQTDLILTLNNLSVPVSGFLLSYLGRFLTAQAETLAHCAEMTTALGQSLTTAPAPSGRTSPARPAQSSYTLESARRGLREADAALRKAMASISNLEAGFATILNKETSSPPARLGVAITPDIFEGPAKEVMSEVGTACAKIAPSLQATADLLRQTLAASPGFTIAAYEQSYAKAVETARAAYAVLVEVLALLRLEIASETLPLLAWQVHQQVQEIAESLRWGALGEA